MARNGERVRDGAFGFSKDRIGKTDSGEILETLLSLRGGKTRLKVNCALKSQGEGNQKGPWKRKGKAVTNQGAVETR